MWLTEKINEQTRRERETARRGTVTLGGANAAVWSRGEEREIPLATPGGYLWRPCRGESVLVIKGGEESAERYIAGAVAAAQEELEEGEVCLFSSGGAKVCLRNDGSIELFGALYINGELYVNGEPYEPPAEGV